MPSTWYVSSDIQSTVALLWKSQICRSRHLATYHTTTLINTIYTMCIIFKSIGAQRLVYAFNAMELWKERQPREEWVHWLEVVDVFFLRFSHFVWFRREKLIRCPFLQRFGCISFCFLVILWMSAILENSTYG